MTLLKRFATFIVLFVFFFVVVYLGICIVGGAVSGGMAGAGHTPQDGYESYPAWFVFDFCGDIGGALVFRNIALVQEALAPTAIMKSPNHAATNGGGSLRLQHARGRRRR